MKVNSWLGLADNRQRLLRILIPTPGNILFTILALSLLVWAQSAGALPFNRPSAAPSTSTIAYQGRLADTNDQPINATLGMTFRLYNVASGGTVLWSESWNAGNSVAVRDGLFNVMLGSLNAVPQSIITSNTNLWLGITIGSDAEMSPRAQLGSVPYATQALIVPDDSISSAKIVDGTVANADLANNAVTAANIADGTIATADLGNSSVTSAKLTDSSVTTAKIADGTIGTIDLSDSSISSAKIADGSIANADIAGNAVTTSKLLDGTIVNADLADNSITSAKINDSSISAADLAASSVTTAKLADGTIATVDIANNAISTAKLADSSVTTTKLSDASVLPQKLALPTKTACVESSFNLPVLIADIPVVIPGLQLGLTLAQTSTLLVWVDGLARYNYQGVGESYFMLRADGIELTGAVGTETGTWISIKGQRIIQLGGGSHSIDMEVHADIPGTAYINGGQSGSNVGFRTCINYLIIN